MAKGDKVSWTNYTEQQKAKGLIKVAAWIPEACRDEFLDIAQEMCVEVGAATGRRKKRGFKVKKESKATRR